MLENLQNIQWLDLSGVIAVLVVLLAVVAIVNYIKARKRGEIHKPDYRAISYIGIIFIFSGVAAENYTTMTVGLIFLAVSYAHKDSWKKKKKFSEMSKVERGALIAGFGILVFLLIATVAMLLLGKG
ncbi:hypothetical protein KJ652_04160 [Patescibacteria group bacterium]|nr:hypothetical protein [Patescibacteria group bacterium]MBU1123760.1 hypothetical protein [Patescibacteria group bacterium]MBU1911270.1 hypothetical protein [Patescibacteria group bacterium]